jgi:inorganic pyrophosphatase/manganese-dependent inorganic pyrophosphatase
MKYIVTTGNTWIDIDGLACVIAYNELLTHEKKDSIASLQAIWNYTIPESVKDWGLKYENEYIPQPGDRYVVMDVSHVTYIHGFLNEDKIIELYDHHFGFEDYWERKLGERTHIEKVGSCSTLVVEQWRKRLPKVNLSSQSANLLGLSIISNTLNFKSLVTDKRDRVALEYLLPYMTLGDGWIANYFKGQDDHVFANPEDSIHNDTKIIVTPFIAGNLAIAQLELWEGESFIEENMTVIKQMIQTSEAVHWLLTVVSIKDGHNYLYTTSQEVKKVLTDKIGATFEGDRGTTETLMLRKEILRELKA